MLVRDGALAEPIREATIASTIQRLLLDITHVGADLEWQPGGTGGVTLIIPDVALSGALTLRWRVLVRPPRSSR